MGDYSGVTRRLAELAVGFGANVQPGQVVAVTTYIGMEELTRAVTRQAYERGARWVDVLYHDPWVKRERIALAPEDSLDEVPPWQVERLEWLSERHAARITLHGPTAPHALDGLDPARAGRDLLPYLPNSGAVVNRRTTNWCVVPSPSHGWAEAVYPELPGDEALERLWSAVARVCRLDEADPVAAWQERMGALERVATRLTERRFDAVRLRGPGTDLTVGLLPSSRWHAGAFETVDGVVHHPNLPSEEVFTTPDPQRAHGVVTATMPRELYGGLVEGIRIELEDGRAVRVEAERGADALRSALAKDDGAARLGELALVDRESRVAAERTVFYETLLDENAASHIALGSGYLTTVEDEADRARVNASGIHVDLMVGSPEVQVDGITAGGEAVPLLRGGDWQL